MIFLFKAHKDYISNSTYFVSLSTSYFSSHRISLNVRTDYFFTLFFEIKPDNTKQENYLHIVHDLKSF